MNINPFDILKNAQKIQEQMGSFQESLAAISAGGSAGGGMVEIEINGKLEVLAVRISPEALEDRDMLQDLVAAAFNSALEKIKEQINKAMGAMAGGMGMTGTGFPGLGIGT
jgi:DNA-binding YbaB/EbfC family protein